MVKRSVLPSGITTSILSVKFISESSTSSKGMLPAFEVHDRESVSNFLCLMSCLAKCFWHSRLSSNPNHAAHALQNPPPGTINNLLNLFNELTLHPGTAHLRTVYRDEAFTW
uniref:Uncharacterized protein n=1 Tax=Glossina austeni TaxID=7395 RepID=A0A1A9VE75_GLOAU